MIEGALILLAGIVVGRFMPGRRRVLKAPKPVQPVCGCGHHRSFHLDGGRCNDKGYQGSGVYGCGCRQYVGPEPLPEFFAQEIGGAS